MLRWKWAVLIGVGMAGWGVGERTRLVKGESLFEPGIPAARANDVIGSEYRAETYSVAYSLRTVVCPEERHYPWPVGVCAVTRVEGWIEIDVVQGDASAADVLDVLAKVKSSLRRQPIRLSFESGSNRFEVDLPGRMFELPAGELAAALQRGERRFGAWPVPARVVSVWGRREAWSAGARVGGVAIALIGALGLLVPGRAWWRRRRGRCPSCGYDIAGLSTCPECGQGTG